ncbi:polygalacturonase-like isoform X1 [Hibiscus syriacus]|uniref:Polygalacturonase-like isoform X1 n=1 Tax=Hibiscus syriacus TaxID=106335 RepID=A0A6A2Y209_HIBSY|nr:polygalacturonase-like isoform X1 [Hibiscus syriacus]
MRSYGHLPPWISALFGCVGFKFAIVTIEFFVYFLVLTCCTKAIRYVQREGLRASETLRFWGILCFEFWSRGCFGCFELSKGVLIQDWKGRSFSEDFWSSTCEIEHGALRSQRSIPSISVPSHSLDLSGSTSHPSEFVNHGMPSSLEPNKATMAWKEKVCNWNVLYHSLRGNNKPFSHPVPLSELVDFLDEVWEQEGFRGGLGKLFIRGNHSTRGVTSIGLRAISRGCPSLRVLSLWNLSSIGDEGLQVVARSYPNLKSISIKKLLLVGDQGIASMLSSASCTLTKVKLQALNAIDVFLAVIGHYGKAVTDLSLTCLQNVSEKGFWVIGNVHGLQKLKYFAVMSCHASSLEGFQLEECHKITQFGHFGFLLNCGAKLKTLSLVNCLGIKDLNLGLPLVSSCKSLRSLLVRSCSGFGDSNLVALGKLSLQLQHVELSVSQPFGQAFTIDDLCRLVISKYVAHDDLFSALTIWIRERSLKLPEKDSIVER